MSIIHTSRTAPTRSASFAPTQAALASGESTPTKPVDTFQPSNDDDIVGRIPGKLPILQPYAVGRKWLIPANAYKPPAVPTGTFGWAKGVGFGALGLYGAYSGMREVGKGIDQIDQGNSVQGGLTVTSGVATSLGGVSSALVSVGLGNTALRCFGPGAFGVAAMADGVNGIYQGYKNGDVDQTSRGFGKAGAGSLMLAGALSLNPLLVGVGAVSYAAVWTSENADPIADLLVNAGDNIRTSGTQIATNVGAGGHTAVAIIDDKAKRLVGGAAQGGQIVVNGAQAGLNGSIASTASVANAVVDLIPGNGAVEQGAHALVNGLQTSGQVVVGQAAQVAQQGIALAEQGGQAIVDGTAALANGAVNVVQTGTQAVVDGAATAVDGVVNGTIYVGNAVSQGVGDAASAVGSGISKVWGAIWG